MAQAIKQKQQVKPGNASPATYTDKRIFTFIFLFCFILYGNSISNKYALDDEIVTLGNKHVDKGLKGIGEIFTSHHSENSKQSYGYRPIVLVTYAIEHQFFKQNPFVSHFLNIVLYAISCCMLYLLLKQLLNKYHHVFVWIIMILFIAHPLHTEVVDNLKSRDEILAFLFLLLTTRCALNYFRTENFKYLGYALVFFILSLLSKISGLTYIVIIPLIAYFFIENVTKKKIGIYFSFIALCYLLNSVLKRSLVAKGSQRDFLFFENPLYGDKNILHRISSGFYTYFEYFKLHLFPHPLRYYYGYNQVELLSLSNPILYISIMVIACMVFFALKMFKQKHILSFALLYILITMSMYANVIKPAVGIIAERFMYIPSVGVCILFAYLLLKFFKVDIENKNAKINLPSNFYYVFIAIILLYSGKVISRNKDWKNHITLYTNDMQYLGESAKAHALLAARIFQDINAGKIKGSREENINNVVYHYKESLRIYPDYITSLNNLGSVYFMYFQDFKTALPYFERAVALDSTYVEAYFNLASTQGKLGDVKNTELNFKKSLQLNPDYINSYISLTKFYIENGRKQDAIDINKKGIAEGIKNGMLYVNIGNIYITNQDTAQAIQYYESAVSTGQSNANLCNFLAGYFNGKKDFQKANYYSSLAQRASFKAKK
jgi:tetratricopeptide (TPR) repeat protein